jgi:hypothetical protein
VCGAITPGAISEIKKWGHASIITSASRPRRG